MQCLQKVKHRFRDAPHHILNRGFSVSTGNAQLRRSVGGGIRNLLASNAPAPRPPSPTPRASHPSTPTKSPSHRPVAWSATTNRSALAHSPSDTYRPRCRLSSSGEADVRGLRCAASARKQEVGRRDHSQHPGAQHAPAALACLAVASGDLWVVEPVAGFVARMNPLTNLPST